MIWSSVSDIQTLQIEITSLCQAGCIDCNRWRPINGYMEWKQTDHTEWVLNSDHHHFNRYYDCLAFDSHIGQFTALDYVQFCGNVGDPMAHPHISECCRFVYSHRPNCYIDISTNGAIGTLDQYKELANLSVKDGLTVTFAVDGLEDTNHIYRRGVKWSDLILRIKTFIEHGGKANWQWIDFPHSRHQISQGRKVSEQMGFIAFEVIQRFTKSDNFDQEILYQSNKIPNRSTYHIEPQYLDYDLDAWHQTQLEELHAKNIHVDARCKSYDASKFYHPCPQLNVDGTVWPCCYTANGVFHASPHIRRWWQQLEKNYGKGWNNLHNHSLQTILNNNFFQTDLEKSWSNNLICLTHCGKCIN